MTAVTRALADFAASVTHDRLPTEVAERVKLLVFDTVGIALRARHEAGSTPSLMAAVAKLGLTGGDATVIGDTGGYTPPGAALINGALAHSLDFDDTHARGSIHSSAPIVPASFAAAEMTGASGPRLLAGIVAGYEVQIRLSIALGPSDHYARGFHPTATCGAFGATVAAANIFGLSAEAIERGLGICLSQTAGSMQFLFDGAWTKRFHVGHAAMCGLTAACLAGEGFRGPAEAIEGKDGFLNAYAPNPDPAKAVEGLGSMWETMAIAVKPYPSCRFGHAAIDALVELRAANDIKAGAVESVEVGLPQVGWNIIGDPEPDKQNPKNLVDCQFSMPFVAAVALREGGMAWDDYARHIEDDETMDLCRRVTSVVDAQAEAEYPANLSGVVRLRTGKGAFEAFVAVPKGEPDNFVTPAELRAKFDGLTGPYLDAGDRDALAMALMSLDQADDAGAVLRLTCPSAPARAVAGA
jgi:2-methylcitrate dehydratase PrpD